MADDRVPLVISHYLVESLLGVGGMGVVYSGVDQRDGSPVAIKLLHRHLSEDPEFRERFEREAHLAALLRSPYTVQLIEYGIAEGRCFMVMEYIDGETLGQPLRAGPLPVGRALRIATQAARALEEAHARGVVHRDIKPENILLLGDSARVSDFGIARRIGATTQTLPGGFYGTVAYAAPEQLTGEADHRTDIWALGATLFHMLAGRPPFTGQTEEVLRQIANEPAPFELMKEQPEDAVSIISRCLEKAPENRYASAAELATDLERAARGLSTTAGVSTAPGPSTATVIVQRGRAPDLLSMRLTPLAGSRTAARVRPVRFALEVRNDSDEPLQLELRAEDRGGACRFALPGQFSLGAHSTAKPVVKVWPKKRRWRGKPVTRIFTVFGSGGDGPPATASARFEDLPFGWVPLGGVASAGAAVALLAGGAFAAGLVGPEPEPEPLKIGLLMPFSGARFGGESGAEGSWQEYGQAYLNAARIAVGEINAGGGVLGQTVVLVQGDTAGDSNVGIPGARRLVEEEGVQAVIGDMNFDSSLAIANEVTNPAGVVQITPNSITEADVLGLNLETAPPFLFKTQMRPDAEGVALAQLVLEGQYDTACLVFDEGHPAGTKEALKRSIPGVQVVEVEHINEFVAGLSEEQQVAALDETAATAMEQCVGAGAVVLMTYPDVLPLTGGEVPGEEEQVPPEQLVPTSFLLEAALDRQLGPVFASSTLAEKLIFGPEASGYAFDGIGWDRAAGVRGTRARDPKERQGARFDETYRQQFGEPPAELQDPSRYPADLRTVYDAVYLIALAAEKAGSTDPDAIRKALPDIANAPGTVVRPGPIGRNFLEVDPVSGIGPGARFAEAVALIAGGEEIDYEGAAGPIEFNGDRDNVRGAVEIWRVDPQARTLVNERLLTVDFSTGEAYSTDLTALRAYFEASKALWDEGREGIAALYEMYPEAFKGYPEPGAFQGDLEQTKALYAEYVSLYQDNLDRSRDLDPPPEVEDLHRRGLAANERVNAVNHERLRRLQAATTAGEVDAIFVDDPGNVDFTYAVDLGIELCLEGNALAADYGIEVDRRCEG